MFVIATYATICNCLKPTDQYSYNPLNKAATHILITYHLSSTTQEGGDKHNTRGVHRQEQAHHSLGVGQCPPIL
jgi:hypothetical protein